MGSEVADRDIVQFVPYKDFIRVSNYLCSSVHISRESRGPLSQ